MNWPMIMIGFALAVVMGAGLSALLANLRPQWSKRRRILIAAGFLPAVTLTATAMLVAAYLATSSGQGGDMRDLAAASLAAIGGLFALLALVGGMVGASLAQKRRGA